MTRTQLGLSRHQQQVAIRADREPGMTRTMSHDHGRGYVAIEHERTIQGALETWQATIRLCLLYLARGAPIATSLWVLTRH
ncbi:MAG TPA: hypothetical protein VLW50_29355 [Streptosporangiaceae bacterium]|nr:hypothetical protein [Streptosporangiaceae bacterium]